MCQYSWCDCSEEEHDEYRECPIFNDQMICDVCCDYDILSSDAADLINKKTSMNITMEEIFDMCIKCNKNLIQSRIKNY